MFSSEPVAIIGIIVAALTAIQGLAIPMSASVHTAIAIVLVVLGAIIARTKVAPAA